MNLHSCGQNNDFEGNRSIEVLNMKEEKTIVDISGLGQVGSTLIERISVLCGSLYHNNPKTIARSTLIEHIKNSDLSIDEKYVLISNIGKVTKEYNNQNKMLSIAVDHLKESSRPDEVDESWIVQFMDKARLISIEQTQIIWGKILAQECNNPNSVPKSLLFSLEQMDKEDANSFMDVCSCTVILSSSDDESACPIIRDFNEGNYWKTNLTFERILRLEALGLIKQDLGAFNTGFQVVLNSGSVVARYAKESFDFPAEQKNIPVDRVIYTRSGQALYQVIDAPTFEGFLESQCVPYWQSVNLKQESNRNQA